MKTRVFRISVFFVFMSLPLFSFSQTLKRQTIGSMGNYSSDQGLLLRQTIGQAYDTKTSYGTGISYSPGFQQKESMVIDVVKKQISVRIYPNPTPDYAVIKTSTTINNVTLRFVDQLGRVLFTETIGLFEEYTLDCSEFPDGQYFVTLTFSDTQTFAAKIIVLQ